MLGFKNFTPAEAISKGFRENTDKQSGQHFVTLTDRSGAPVYFPDLSVTNPIDETAFDLNAAAFSETTDVSNDYIFDSIELNFSTAESKTITLTSSDGTILWGGSVDTSSSNLGYNTTKQHFNLCFGQAFNGGENITVAVTQTSGACLMDCVLKVKQGSENLAGNPSLGAGDEIIGRVKLTDGTETVNVNSFNELNVTSRDFILNVSMGKVPGARIFGKFAEQPNLTSGVKSDLWDYGPTEPSYIYSAGNPLNSDAVADITHFSSSSASDTQDWLIYGLDIDGYEVEQAITMVGQTKTALSTPLWRVYRVVNISENPGVNNVGDIYVYTDTAITTGVPDDTTKVKAYVAVGKNITRMAQYTIPRGETGFLISIDSSITKKNAFVDWENEVRFSGSVFFSPNIFSLASTGSSKDNTQILAFERTDELTDLRTLVTSDINGAGATIVVIWLYLDNAIWGL